MHCYSVIEHEFGKYRKLQMGCIGGYGMLIYSKFGKIIKGDKN